MAVVDGAYDQMLPGEEHAASMLAGGILGQGYQCGQLWGAALAAGARAHRLYGPGPQAEAAAITTMQRLTARFAADYGDINCTELTELSLKNPQAKDVLKFLGSGRILRCFGMSGSFAQTTYREIAAAPTADAQTAARPDAPTTLPVSCAALLARRLGASELHQTMAAGFAGGIGLSGGACGALGAAIWLHSLAEIAAGSFSISPENPGAQAIIDCYLAATDYQYECVVVVGRRFRNVDDHADYVRAGGCAALLDALAASPRS